MHDRPNVQELIEAVAEFIERELLPTVVDQRLRFRGLVAANVLAIAGRELAAGDAPLRDEWRRLSELTGNTEVEPPVTTEALHHAVQALNREVCTRIRAGRFDSEDAFGLALDQVQVIVAEKLRITNPRYLARVARE
jgi:hypothetical protein